MSHQIAGLGHGAIILCAITDMRARGDAEYHMAVEDKDEPRQWRWLGYGVTVDTIYGFVSQAMIGDTANTLLRMIAHEECRLDNNRPRTWMHLMEREGARLACRNLRAIVLAP